MAQARNKFYKCKLKWFSLNEQYFLGKFGAVHYDRAIDANIGGSCVFKNVFRSQIGRVDNGTAKQRLDSVLRY